MRVLAFCENSYIGLTPSGGAERMIHQIMRYMRKQGHHCTALVSHGLRGRRLVVDDITALVPVDADEMHSLVKEADLVITHLGGTVQARLIAKIYGKPVVQVIHNTSHYSVGFLGSGSDYAIYNSDWVKDFHENAKGDLLIQSWKSNTQVDYRARMCFDWPSMVLTPPVMDPIDLNYNNPHGKVTLVNLVPNKGPDIFYALAERNPDVEFLGVIGGYEESNQQIRKDLPNVEIMDHKLKMDDIYSRSSVVLMPSKYESWGYVAVEAIQRGIPAIVARTPGLLESMGPHGLFCERDNLDEWQRTLEFVLENYEFCRLESHKRYKELLNRSVSERQDFALEMEGLVKRWAS